MMFIVRVAWSRESRWNSLRKAKVRVMEMSLRNTESLLTGYGWARMQSRMEWSRGKQDSG